MTYLMQLWTFAQMPLGIGSALFFLTGLRRGVALATATLRELRELIVAARALWREIRSSPLPQQRPLATRSSKGHPGTGAR